MFDDFSPRMNAYGDRVAVTPSLDQFSHDAIQFNHAYSTAPVCSPSRAAMMTGQYQWTIGAMHHRTRGLAGGNGGAKIAYETVPPLPTKSFTELLRSRGYATYRTGKADYQFGEPFTMWDAVAQDDYRGDLLDKIKDGPFFAWINLNHTHESYLWPALPERNVPIDRATYLRTIERNRAFFVERPDLIDPSAVTVPPYLLDTARTRADIARQYNNGSFDDNIFGKIISDLKKRNIYDDSIIVVAGDQGDGLPRMKRAIYKSGIWVPLLIKLPNQVHAGEKRDNLASLVDIAPTILRLAGFTPPQRYQGIDLLSKDNHRRRYVFAGVDRQDEVPDRVRSVIDGRYQLIVNFHPEWPLFRENRYQDVLPSMAEIREKIREGAANGIVSSYFRPRTRVELFDNIKDPDSRVNLANDRKFRSVRQRLERALMRMQIKWPDFGTTSEDVLINQMWPNGVQPKTSAPTVSFARLRTKDCRFQMRVDGDNGASVGFQIKDANEPGRWSLYSSPVSLNSGSTVQVKAVRYGYGESPTIVANVPPCHSDSHLDE